MTKFSPKFGPYGGQYVPETLMPALEALTAEFERARRDENFQSELNALLADYAGRPTPVSHAARLSAHLGGARIYLKREDLAHTGAHKINNALGQALLARRMGKRRIIAETGAGQHGVASATVAALLGLECVVYMGEVDMARQQPNVFRMRLLGAEVRPVASGSRTLKDAVNEAIRDWVTNVETTHYLLGSALGPHPYPTMVREFQRVIGDEARAQMLAKPAGLPDACIACVGGGSNAIGLFSAFLERLGRSADRRGSRRRRDCDWAARGALCGSRRAAGSACCTARARTSCRPPTGRSPIRIPSRPGWITPRSGRSIPSCATRAARNTPSPPTPRPSPRSRCFAGSRESSRRWRVRTPWPKPSAARRNWAKRKSSWFAFRGGATRIWIR